MYSYSNNPTCVILLRMLQLVDVRDRYLNVEMNRYTFPSDVFDSLLVPDDH